MTQRNDLSTNANDLPMNSLLFWLVVLPAVGIIFIGARFIIAPLVGAAGFGIPVDSTDTYAYLWAKGTRDIVSGLFVIVFLWIKVTRQVLSAFLFVVALIPLGDLLNVYINIGMSNIAALMIHGGTALYLIVLASVLLKRSR
ncbi:MAG: DUF4267 domain-containing protein [Nostoc sp.]|uniref:DUF4267 domain-containing protein n=1 Tax=Nostoc sp. TaxID=1180 RepID=UPI002FFCE31D